MYILGPNPCQGTIRLHLWVQYITTTHINSGNPAVRKHAPLKTLAPVALLSLPSNRSPSPPLSIVGDRSSEIFKNKMGGKLKKALKKKKLTLKHRSKSSSTPLNSHRDDDSTDFLPLEGGPARDIPQEEEQEKNTATVLYIGHIPHGFYEEQMEGFFNQFGKVKRLRIARNKGTGKSKHYGFLEFENPEVAKVVADEIHNYLLFEHNLQIHLIPPERVHPKLWKGVNRKFIPLNWRGIARKKHNKEKTVEEYKRMIHGIVKRDEKRRKRIKDAGIDYECPELVGLVQPAAKKIKFDDED